MDGFLRQSTASQVRQIGPFIDDTDFKTVEDGLTIANTDIKVSKNGAAVASKNSGGGTSLSSFGMYAVTWDATDTATVGQLRYAVSVSGALVVWGTYTVLEEAVYDQLFAASAPGAGTGTSTLDAAGVRTAVGLASANVDTQLSTIASSASSAASSASTAASSAGTAVTQTTASAIRADVGLASANLDTQLTTIDDFLDTEIAAIVTATGAAAIRTALGLASANVDTQLAAILARTPSASSITNMNTVFNTDFAVNYDTGIGWSVSATIDLGAGAITEEVFAAGAISARVIEDGAIDQGALDSSALQAIAQWLYYLENLPEVGQESASAEPTFADAIGWLYKLAVCKKDNDGNTIQFYRSDNTTVDHTQAVSESGGTVTKDRIESGP